MLKYLIGVIAALGVLTACHTASTPPEVPDASVDATPADEAAYERISFEGERATQAERAKCEAAGGELHRAGLLGWENCIQPYADAGQTCSDSSDCTGGCRYTGSGASIGETVTGTCQINDSPFGCFQSVDNGRATPPLCVD